ncbi:ras guanine nucleotide exchange factor B-like [Osmia bicornis bicornis]|uniref:ras guanine nucleotide exchange factor B-like n=1 Tax=Osmia bicornis bicornis TaxID=1437191 RepID=UPI001EAF51BC|nr:ras guanine nucleotide exchange factor B-like [Osmia bicornis bicornis]
MKVKYCAQVFSQSVGSVMTLMSRNKVKSVCGTREMSLEGVDTARFIHFMNDIFDSVNSSRPLPVVDTNCDRPNIWDVGINVFRSMTFIKRKFADKERPLVVHNWIKTLQNFKVLTTLLGNLGFSHFIGRNFNQDALENFFGQIRQYVVATTNASSALAASSETTSTDAVVATAVATSAAALTRIQELRSQVQMMQLQIQQQHQHQHQQQQQDQQLLQQQQQQQLHQQC